MAGRERFCQDFVLFAASHRGRIIIIPPRRTIIFLEWLPAYPLACQRVNKGISVFASIPCGNATCVHRSLQSRTTLEPSSLRLGRIMHALGLVEPTGYNAHTA